MALLILLTAALLGLVFGSFLTVCVVRLPAHESVIAPRSHCRNCDKSISALENIPIVSWLLLKGACRQCRQQISALYPLIELATAVWFVVAALPLSRALDQQTAADVILSIGVYAVAKATLGFLLIGLAVMDWQTLILPGEFTIGGLILGMLFTFAESFFVPAVRVQTLFTPEEVLIAGRLGTSLAAFVLLKAISLIYRLVRRRAGMGGGDAWLAAMLGMFLGPWPLGVALFTGLTLAFLWALVLLVRHRGSANTRVPFGAFLCVGGLFAAIWGQRIADWYRALFI